MPFRIHTVDPHAQLFTGWCLGHLRDAVLRGDGRAGLLRPERRVPVKKPRGGTAALRVEVVAHA